MTVDTVMAWVEAYERAWRTPGTDALADLLSADAIYLVSPWKPPIAGIDAIRRFWEAGRQGPDEAFTMRAEPVAVDGPTAVVRVFVDYHRPTGRPWRDLWVMQFDSEGRCAHFEEWPFSPEQDDGQGPG
jgi:ketosteroid isomerase-like protein